MSMAIQVNKQYCGKPVYATSVDTTGRDSTAENQKPLRVSPKLLVELGVCKSHKAAYNTLSFLVRTGKAKRLGRGKYVLYPGSSTYTKVSIALKKRSADLVRVFSAVGLGGVVGGGRWWRWRVVFLVCLRDGGVSPGFVAGLFGWDRRRAWWLLERMRRVGVLRRVRRGWYVLAWVVGVTRVDSAGLVVSNRSVFGKHVSHPVLGFELWGFLDPVRGGSVQLGFAKTGRLSSVAKSIQVYSYRHGGRWWWKVEPSIRVRKVGDPVEAVLLGLQAIGDLYSALRPLGVIASG